MNYLKGEKIYLRALEPLDSKILYRWENDTQIWKLSNTIAPFSMQVMEEYIKNAQLDIYTTKQLRLMICLNNQTPIGCIDLFDFDPSNRRAGIGILIAEESNRQKGFASEALQLLIHYCFDVLHLHQLFCNILVDNTSSVRLFQKFKFCITGTKKDWLREKNTWKDEYLLQLINS